MSDLPPGAGEIVAARAEQGVILQLGGCCGCLTVITLALSLLAWAMLKADRETQITPQQAEASLAAIFSCQVPPGYRGFRGIVRGGRRIVLLTPHTHSGLGVPLDGRLTLSVWTSSSPGDESLREVRAYFEDKLREEFRGELAEPREEPLELLLRGAPLPARTLSYTCGPAPGVEVRLVLAHFPRQADSGREHAGSGTERVAVGAIGGAERFDQAALELFLQSVR